MLIIGPRGASVKEHFRYIFKISHGPAPGSAFLPVNDHDPKPLHRQFRAKLGDSFGWEYLEKGPPAW